MNLRRNEFPKRGEIWIANYNFKFSDLSSGEEGYTVESKIKKGRPCLIISINVYNMFNEVVFTVPLTSDNITELEEPLEVLINADKLNNLNRSSKALITLTTYLSKHRLKKRIGLINEETMREVTEKLTDLIS